MRIQNVDEIGEKAISFRDDDRNWVIPGRLSDWTDKLQML